MSRESPKQVAKPVDSGSAAPAHPASVEARRPAEAKAPAETKRPADPKRPVSRNETGRVNFDERGNAVWEWSVSTGAFGREVSTQRLKKLENPGLSLAEDAPTPVDRVRPNPQGTVKGYNPYESGQLGKKEPPRKKDLKRLGEWLALQKQAANNKDDDE